MQELIEYARSNPGKINCGTPPLGSPSNMTLEYLCLEADMQIVGVPYQGHTQILTDVLGGQIEIGLVSVPQAQELVRTGGVKALAVTSEHRAKVLPDVPTVAESGFDGFEASLWNVLVMRKGTPQEILEKLNKATNDAFSGAEIQAQLALHSIEFRPHTLQETAEFVAREQDKWARIVKGAGITPS